MFYGAQMFTGIFGTPSGISSWQTGNIQSAPGMFRDARVFNADISGWDLSGVRCDQNQYVVTAYCPAGSDSWTCTTEAGSMKQFLYYARGFNHPLTNLLAYEGNDADAGVCNMESFFYQNSALDLNAQNWASWNTRQVTSMKRMLQKMNGSPAGSKFIVIFYENGKS